ncbi:cytochrome c3 family protein [Candidatus Uabimicrobium amorphum]|uniref:Cytochrome c n=1 Tax=Uabimicrobium amorphum TaxID=2596890 RepID=A0A5S9IRY5_UABAM|nr:cytochrome c3 family protein [Candidatus Uabimicrobium amorphum]BBM86999.1 cytochrome c [Candidatus Uabimicrobium amorphum]
MPKLILTSVIVGFHGFFVLLGIAYGYGVEKHAESLEQPIAFSHYKHVKKAGLQCNYCHTKAATTTRAGIPPIETCMECHNAIKTDSPEIQKIHAYYGKQLFEVDAEEHKKDLAEGKLTKLEKIFAQQNHILPVTAMLQTKSKDSKWKITDTGQEDKEYEVVENEGVLEVRGVKKPIPWKRVYWVPDHVYFSHKRHIKNEKSRYFLFNAPAQDEEGVEHTEYLNSLTISDALKSEFVNNKMPISDESKVVAKSDSEWWINDPDKDQPYSITKEGKHIKVSKVGLDCTECHGKVQYMGIPRKLPSLRMGWCVQCHTKKGASLDCVTCHK